MDSGSQRLTVGFERSGAYDVSTRNERTTRVSVDATSRIEPRVVSRGDVLSRRRRNEGTPPGMVVAGQRIHV